MELKKGAEHIVEIIDNGIDGEGIAKIDNFTIFVPQTIKGEKEKIQILKEEATKVSFLKQKRELPLQVLL